MFDKRESLKVKGIAICMLLFHHLFYSQHRISTGGVEFHLFSQELIVNIATGMRLCVWVFAFISAYGLTKQYLALGSAPTFDQRMSFVKKHWFSTMKPYWLIFLIVFVVAALVHQDALALFEGSVTNLFLSAFGLSDYFGTPMPVAAWWYMCFAQLLIVFIPFLIELCQKFGWITLLASFFLVPYWGSGINSQFGGSYLNYLFVIILGILCAQTNLLEKFTVKGNHWVLRFLKGILLLAVIIACVSINMNYASADTWKFTKLFMALAAALLCVVSYKFLPGRVLGDALVFLGKHSGNIFLIHAFTYTYWPELTYWSHNVPLTFATVLSVSLAGSILCQFVLRKVLQFRGTGLKQV